MTIVCLVIAALFIGIGSFEYGWHMRGVTDEMNARIANWPRSADL